jgi:chromate transporter
VAGGATSPPAPPFREALRFWLKLGFISFGGPTGQIAIMHAELVDRKRWISNARFLYALNYCMLLPGPEAQQFATYIGWLLHRTAGGLAAGILFVLPSALLLWLLSFVYVRFGEVPQIAAVLEGKKLAPRWNDGTLDDHSSSKPSSNSASSSGMMVAPKAIR